MCQSIKNNIINLKTKEIEQNYQYVCQLCGQIFLSEEDLTQHILKNHITKQKSVDSEIQELKDILKNMYPDYENAIIKLNNQYYKYQIKLINKSGAIINQYYKNDTQKFLESEEETPRIIDRIEDLITNINHKVNNIKVIIDNLNNTEKFEYIKFISFDYGNYGFSEYESAYIFKFKTKDGLYEDTVEYKPYQQTLDEFINGLKQYFETEIEGIGEIISDQGYLLGYTIDNINIEGIFNKAKLLGKQIKLQII